MASHGVSRPTVRRALGHLARDKLVVSVPGRGWQVCAAAPRAKSNFVKSILVCGGPTGRAASLTAIARRHLGATGYEVYLSTRLGVDWPSKQELQGVGSLLAVSGSGIPSSVLEPLKSDGCPVLCIGYETHAAYDCVGIDHRHGFEQLTLCLLEQGYKRIGFITADELVHSVPGFLSREAGYCTAVGLWGLAPWIHRLPFHHLLGQREQEGLTGWLRMAEQQGVPVDALICASYHLSEQACTLLNSESLRKSFPNLPVFGFKAQRPLDVLDRFRIRDSLLLEDAYDEVQEIIASRLLARLAGETSPPALTLVAPRLRRITKHRGRWRGVTVQLAAHSLCGSPNRSRIGVEKECLDV